jgi:lantibiotic modifying enzyme
MRSKLLEPAALRDEAVQLATLTRLVSPMLGDVTDKEEAVLIAERAQLGELDVPYFEQPIAGRDLVIDDAGVTLDFFAHSGLDAACRRIESLESDDVHLQLAIIEGLIAAKARRAHRGQRQVAAVGPHDWGKRKSERELILRLHATKEDIPSSGIVLDATQPLGSVVDEILSHVRI